MYKNDFVFSCITGYAIPGRNAGAENDGWRDRDPVAEAIGYHDAIESGDLGEDLQRELSSCDDDFDPHCVGRMIRLAQEHPEFSSEEIIELVMDQYASDAFVDTLGEE